MGHLIKPFGTLKSIFLQKWSALGHTWKPGNFIKCELDAYALCASHIGKGNYCGKGT